MRCRSICLVFAFSLMSVSSVFSQVRWINALKRGDDLKIVFYGTSLTAGDPGKVWVEGLRDSLNSRYKGKVSMYNAAQVAMHSDWGVNNLKERVLSPGPDVVFIEFAINDAFLPYNISLKVSALNLRYMIDRIRTENPSAQIVLQIMNPPVGEHLKSRADFDQYYNQYKAIGGRSGVKVIDHGKYWKEILKDTNAFKRWVPDGIHPSAEASRKLILPYILSQLK